MVIWMDLAAFTQDGQPAVEVKINDGTEDSWKLTGADRDAAFSWSTQLRQNQATSVRWCDEQSNNMVIFNTKIFNTDHIVFVNKLSAMPDGSFAFEIVTSDQISHKLKDDDAAAAARFFGDAVQSA